MSSPDGIAECAIDVAVDRIGASVGALGLLDDAGAVLRIVVSTPRHSAGLLAEGQGIPLDAQLPVTEAARENRTILAASPDELRARYPVAAEALAGTGVRSVLATPVTVNGRVLGAIALGFATDHAVSNEDEEFVARVAALCAQAIVRTQRYRDQGLAREAAALAADRACRLQWVTAALSAAATPEAVGAVIVHEGIDALGATSGAVLRLDGESLALMHSVGYSPEVLEPFRRFPLDLPVPVCDAVRARRPVYLRSPNELNSRYPTPIQHRSDHEDGAWAALPLAVGQRVLGAVTLSFARSRDFDPGERKFIETLARQCAQALERAWLFEAAEREAEERRAREADQRLLAEASILLTATLDPRQVIAVLSRAAIPRLGDYCVIDLLGERGEFEWVEVAHVLGTKEPIARAFHQRYPPGSRDPGAPIGTVLRTGAPFVASGLPEAFMADASIDAMQRDSIAMIRPRSLIVHPLFARGRTVGTIRFVASEADRTYTDDDVRLAAEVARRGALAYDNATLYVAAQQANKAKSEFLATMSHELRTPLTAIAGYAELIADGVLGPVNATQKDHAECIGASSDRLRILIDDILSLSRIEAGESTVAVGAFDLAETCREAVATVRPIASRTGLAVEVCGVEALPMHSDLVKVRHILINLVANAVKFTDRGSVTITLDGTDGQAVVTVRDTGPGIAPEKLPRVFEMFWQGDQSFRRRHEGTGLGLSVARRLAEMLGGTITVESTLGTGTEFVVSLPTDFHVKASTA